MRLLLLLAIACSGCALRHGMIIITTTDALEAFLDGQAGLITDAKTSTTDGNSAAWMHRYNQEEERTEREMGQFNQSESEAIAHLSSATDGTKSCPEITPTSVPK